VASGAIAFSDADAVVLRGGSSAGITREQCWWECEIYYVLCKSAMTGTSVSASDTFHLRYFCTQAACLKAGEDS